MTNAAAEPIAEVWLRGNVRPVLGLTAVAAAVGKAGRKFPPNRVIVAD